MSRDAALYVADMIEACERVLRFTKDAERADLAAGSMVHDAVLRNLGVLAPLNAGVVSPGTAPG